METTDDYKKIGYFCTFIIEATRDLSTESIEKIFSEETLQRTAQCKNTKEFIGVINALDVQELGGRNLREDSDIVLDRFFQSGIPPKPDEVKRKIEQLQPPSKGLGSDMYDGAIAGAAGGALAGAAFSGFVTIPVGGVGAGVGAAAGAVAGAVGGAIGGFINWLRD